ncbi:tetratricopeptide repeat protein [Desulfolithobacter dissulfuricans]|nr:tetratricopeptide repeat protein [Desulfolithobacter dissulfuricans]
MQYRQPSDTITSDPQQLFTRAVAMHQQGNMEAAEEAYHQVLGILPGHPKVLANLGLLYATTGRRDRAIQCYRQALEKAPQDPSIHINLGALHEEEGQGQEALFCYRRALQADPANAIAHNNLGKLLADLGRTAEAAHHLELALQEEPDYPLALNNLGVVYAKMDRLQEAADCFRRSLDLVPGDVRMHYNLAGVYLSDGRSGQAKEQLQQVLEQDPRHAPARHLLAACTGQTTAQAPPSYVQDVFDRYAGHFDTHIQEVLGYTVPRDLRTLFDDLAPEGLPLARGVDLGCGTGLAGQVFRDLVGDLTGVDLSSGMLAQARAKAVYDRLHQGDIVAFLGNTDQRFDLLLAADVFIYLGDLQPVFAAMAASTVPGGWLLFSVEDYAAGEKKRGYVLRESGRYAHDDTYLRTLAAEHGFTVRATRTQGIRREKCGWIDGRLYVLQKNVQPSGEARKS